MYKMLISGTLPDNKSINHSFFHRFVTNMNYPTKLWCPHDKAKNSHSGKNEVSIPTNANAHAQWAKF